MKKTIVINLFAGPGTGKSSLMGGIFSELKWRGVDCEQAPEYAKEKVWELTDPTLEEQIIPPTLLCQPYVFAKQLFRIDRLNGKMDVIITDSPLLLSLIYGHREPYEFSACVLAYYNKFNNLNYFLKRVKKFNPNGRMQNEAEAREIDDKVLGMLGGHLIPYEEVAACRETACSICDTIEGKLKEQQ